MFVTTVPSNVRSTSPNQTLTATPFAASVPKFVTFTRMFVVSPAITSPSKQNESSAKPTSIPDSRRKVLSSTAPYSAAPAEFVVTDTDSYAIRSAPSLPTAPVMLRSCAESERNNSEASPMTSAKGSYVAQTVSAPDSLAASRFQTSIAPPSARGTNEKSGVMSQPSKMTCAGPNPIPDTRFSPSSQSVRKTPLASYHANGLVASVPAEESRVAFPTTPFMTETPHTSRASDVAGSPSPSFAYSIEVVEPSCAISNEYTNPTSAATTNGADHEPPRYVASIIELGFSEDPMNSPDALRTHATTAEPSGATITFGVMSSAVSSVRFLQLQIPVSAFFTPTATSMLLHTSPKGASSPRTRFAFAHVANTVPSAPKETFGMKSAVPSSHTDSASFHSLLTPKRQTISVRLIAVRD